MELGALQNKIKRDPRGYRRDYVDVLESFSSQLQVLESSLEQRHEEKRRRNDKRFLKTLNFVANVSHLYPDLASDQPSKLNSFLLSKQHELTKDLRRALFQALQLCRNRGQLPPLVLIESCFSLMDCGDKGLRDLAYAHVLNDVRALNKHTASSKLNRSVQRIVFRAVENESSASDGVDVEFIRRNTPKRALRITIELYKRRVWVDSATVQTVAKACFSTNASNSVAATKFFLGIDDDIDALEEEEAEEKMAESTAGVDPNIADTTKRTHAKKTKSLKRRMEKEKKRLVKAKEKVADAQKGGSGRGAGEKRRREQVRFPAIDLIDDPQKFVDRLFRFTKTSNDHFEVRLLRIDLISRCVGHCRLLLLPFYAYLHRYLRPHQKGVTKFLACFVQACHSMVPPNELESSVRLIANEFINDRVDSESLAVGLNVVREIVNRVPLLTEEMDEATDFFEDLVAYSKYPRDKSVSVAARSLLNCLREVNPSVLKKKKRGRGTDGGVKPSAYGAAVTTSQEKRFNRLVEIGGGDRVLSSKDFKRLDASDDDDDDDDDEDAWSDDSSSEDDEDEIRRRNNVVSLGDLEGVRKQKRRALQDRLERIKLAQEEKHNEAKRVAGLSNKQKEKSTKNFLMVSRSRRVFHKHVDKDFRSQQRSVKRHIKTLQKNKKLLSKIRKG